MVRKILQDGHLHHIVERLKTKSRKAVADEFGVTHGTLGQYLVRMGKSTCRIRFDHRIEVIKANPNLTSRAIAKLCNCSDATINQLKVDHLGFTRPPRTKVQPKYYPKLVEALKTMKQKDVAKKFNIKPGALSVILEKLETSAHTIKYNYRVQYLKDNPKATIQELADAFNCKINAVYVLKRDLLEKARLIREREAGHSNSKS